jgi:hypothetical protein
MMPSFAKLRNATWICSLTLAVFAMPLIALAADDEVTPDARLEGYATQVAIKEGGTGWSIVFLILLLAITLGVMFINAKRSHLD